MVDASCIIPAAGLSSRMGRWKGMLQVREKGVESATLLGRTVRTALKGCRDAVVVAGSQIETVREIVSELDRVTVVENQCPEKGMLNSIQTALPFVSGPFFIVPMDMPLIEADHYEKLYDFFQSQGGRSVVRPRFNGISGHPVLLPGDWNERIRRAEGESLRQFLKPGEVDLLQWGDRSVILDLDTEEAYREYLQISG